MIKILLNNFTKDLKSIKRLKSSKIKVITTDILIILVIMGVLLSIMSPIMFNSQQIKDAIPINLGLLVVMLTLYLLFIISFISSIGLLYSSAYLDKNLDTYITLPIKKRDFTIAKLIFVYKSTVQFVTIVAIPFTIVYIMLQDVSFIALIVIALFVIIAPLITTYISALLVGTILYFINKAKNKMIAKRILHTLVIGVLAISYFAMIFTLTNTEDPVLLLTRVQYLLSIFNNFLFFPSWAADIVISEQYINIVFILLTILVCIPIQLYFEKIYYKSSIGYNQVSYRKSKNKNKKNELKSNSIIKWYYLREFKEIIKTPTYFFNTIFSNILIVIIYLLMLGYNYFTQKEFSSEISALINQYLSFPFVVVITIGVGTFFTLFNYGPATCFSRDAKVLPFIKTLPIDHVKAFFGKILFHSTIEYLTLFIFMIIPMLVLKIPIIYIIASSLIMLLVVLSTILIPICVDLKFPTLDWESETILVKRSRSIIISLLIHFIFVIFIFVSSIVILIKFESVDILSYYLLIFYVIMFFIMIQIYKRLVIKAFKKEV